MIAVDLGGGRTPKEAVKTGGRIQTSQNNAERDLLYVQPKNPDLQEATWMNTAFRGLGYV